MNNQLQQYVDFINKKLKQIIAQTVFPAPQFKTVLEYVVQNGGKRVRPALTLAVTDLLQGERRKLWPAACAVELIHTYSLIHDDLPAMDDDDFRRGQPSCHKKFGEAEAILAGDALQSLAMEVLVRESRRAGVKPEKIVSLVEALSQAAGPSGMVGGQYLDLTAAPNSRLAELKLMHNLKTGALLKFAIMAPMQVLELKAKAREALAHYAQAVGLAFQIKDDILDVESNSAILGKTAGKDNQQNKATYVNILGLKRAKELFEAENLQARQAADYFGKNNILHTFAEFLLKREK